VPIQLPRPDARLLADAQSDVQAASRRPVLFGPEAADLIGRYDSVTKLPNRVQFIEDFPWLRDAEKGNREVLMLITLAEARHYNDILRALGHAFSEDFVRAGAEKLASLLPPHRAIYHVSVLSFVFVTEFDGSTSQPAVAEKIARAFSGSLLVENIPINAVVGVGLVPVDAIENPADALRAALAAAQDSRRTEAGFAFYNPSTDAAHQRAFRILADLPLALEGDGELSLNFQPRITLASNLCHGAEALLRWNHPELGPISPGEFIPLVEQTALIGPLTNWVFDAALRHARQFADTGKPAKVSINASPANLAERGFAEKLLRLCDKHGVLPQYVELEFTEGMMASNMERTAGHLRLLRDAGVEIAIDDFGSGYSSLNYLTRIPADVLKIDQSFIRPLGSDKAGDFLVRQIISLSKGLGFRVCAEGIETRAIYDLLQSLGCDEGQGYYMARPMPASEFQAWRG